ncbi:hypothetical protein H5410_009405 [Solanum commersonii]|uniref:Uncharacterized protein n=1 Tax=Solanum commersonii TaxID=4109 RepID=A0A9J6AIN6_SOLCO|nr:hypothetical protein H5410_009405 [Solanum commersonii]
MSDSIINSAKPVHILFLPSGLGLHRDLESTSLPCYLKSILQDTQDLTDLIIFKQNKADPVS